MRRAVLAGNFDVIHPGYIHTFRESKSYCDHLTIALHDDPSLERPEKIAPILPVFDRQMILLAIRYVDSVLIYKTEKDLSQMMEREKFDVRILGDDYLGKYATGQEYCGRVVYINRAHGWSTTKFKKAIAASLSRG